MLRGPAVAVLAGTVMFVAHAAMVDAQGAGAGRGFGRGRPLRAPGESPPPGAEEDAAPRYPFDFDEILKVVNRDEGREALTWYEQTAAQALERGLRLRAARAYTAAAVVGVRLAMYQKAIRFCGQAIEIFRTVDRLGPGDLGRVSTAYSHLGTAYRYVGDLAQARKTYEDALAFAESHFRGRKESATIGLLSIGLARVALVQRDYQSALDRAAQAARYFEAAIGEIPATAPERQRFAMRRQAASAFDVLGRAQVALGRSDEAQEAYARGLKYARLVGLAETEVEIILSHGNLALARQDWTKALASFQQGITLATQAKRSGTLMWLQQGVARASRRARTHR